MIPNPSAGWYAPPPVATAPPAPNMEAQRRLSDAIEFAGPNEFARLIDNALAQGARIDLGQDIQSLTYESNFLVCAVRANKPWAIPILMARGARVPRVPADGKDLVMDACLAGHAEMVRTLIEVARFDITFHDRRHRTALHYAACGGKADCVAVLLEHRADRDAVFIAMADADLEPVFGARHELNGCGITPLMIAAGRGDEAIVRQLLEAGADPEAGGCSPLIIAAGRNHPAILRTFLASGASLDGAEDRDGRRGLYALLHARASIDCLRIAVQHHDFSDDSDGVQSLLGLAIGQCAPAVVALFLSCYSTTERQPTLDEDLWNHAFQRQHDGCQVLELMAAISPYKEFPEIPERFCKLLREIVDSYVDAPALAADGLFPSLLQPATQALQQLRSQTESLSKRQLALKVAFALLHHLRPLPVPPTAPAIPPECVDLVWVERMETCRYMQQRFLLAQSKALVDECLFMLKRSMSAEFFIDCLEECPEQESRVDFIQARLADDMGLPQRVALMLAAAWAQAAAYITELRFAPNDAGTAGHFGERYTHQRLRNALNDFEIRGDPALAACRELITQTLEKLPAPLTAFCSNPVAWLRQFENRNHLRPVDQTALARALAIELGLPPSTCRGIASAWRQAIDSARASREWQTPAQLTSLLERLMRDPIKEVMGDNYNDKLIPRSDRQLLADWAAAPRTPSATATRKRPADANGDSESSPKHARN